MLELLLCGCGTLDGAADDGSLDSSMLGDIDGIIDCLEIDDLTVGLYACFFGSIMYCSIVTLPALRCCSE